MRKVWKKLLSLGLVTAMCFTLAACGGKSDDSGSSTNSSTNNGGADTSSTGGDEGISADSPYAGKGFDLSNPATVVMYVVGDAPEDLDKVVEKVNTEYLIPWLNSTLEVKFISWADLGTKYSLLLTGSEPVDLMYTASWCNYESETGNGAFKELTPEFLQQYMPYSYPLHNEASWEQAMISDKIYAIPKLNAGFTSYNIMVVRKDIADKYGVTNINSWDSMKDALYKIADGEKANGVFASGQRGKAEFIDHLWWQKVEAEPLVDASNFYYYTHGKEDLPEWDDIFFKFDDPTILDFYHEMAEMASHGVWSENRMNDDTDARNEFVSGKVATLIWNGSVADAGKEMEEAGNGTYELFDVTPSTKASRAGFVSDMTAIPSGCTQPERAALVMDCLTGIDEVNTMIIGGIEGEHYIMNDDGTRSLGEAAEKYPWTGWAWALPKKDIPVHSDDPRSTQFEKICSAKEYSPRAAGFTFDKAPVETEMALVDSVVGEYQEALNLGMYGDQTDAMYDEFLQQLKNAGLDKVMAELKSQYEAYRAKKTQ